MTERTRVNQPAGDASATSGLSTHRAAELLAEVGPNALPQAAAVPKWRQLAA